MSSRRPQARRHALRVALVASAIVGLVLAALCVAIDLVVSHNLQSATAAEVSQQAANLAHGGGVEVREPDVDDPVLSWRLNPSGRLTASTVGAPALPAAARPVWAPTVLRLGSRDYVFAGAGFLNGRIISAESLDSVPRALGELVLAEALVAPLVVLLVFAGALLVGRQVAGPAERARSLQQAFTADASHELRTPLSVIEAETSLALAHEREPQSDAQTLRTVADEAGRLRRIVDDLLWLARFESAPAPPPSEPVDLATLAHVAGDRFRAFADARALQLEIVVPDSDGTSVVSAPPEWIDRLIGVLVDNACRYAPEGGEVKITVATGGGQVRLQVDDSGPGVASAQRARIFDRFSRGDGGGDGAGLGLAIGDAIVRATRGAWQVGESASGGASFSVVWPPTTGG